MQQWWAQKLSSLANLCRLKKRALLETWLANAVFNEVCTDNQAQPCALIIKYEILLSCALPVCLSGKATALFSLPSVFQP